MRIHFLGTGSAWPTPRIGCACPQCVSARGLNQARSAPSEDRRSRASIVLEAAAGGPLVLVDAGPDIYRQLDAFDVRERPRHPGGKAPVERIAGVVITHVHPDHILGLTDLAAALPRAIPLFHLEDNLHILERTFGYLFPGKPGARRTAPEMFEPRLMRFGEPLSLAGVEIVPFNTHHFPEFSTCGLLASAGGKRLAYAPDCRRPEVSLEGLDLLSIDSSTLDRPSGSHMSLLDGITLSNRVKPRRTLFTHVGHVKVPHAELETIAREGGGETCGLAYDGLSVDL